MLHDDHELNVVPGCIEPGKEFAVPMGKGLCSCASSGARPRRMRVDNLKGQVSVMRIDEARE